ncbi:MAG TPA: XRE family transcriptional regulator [Lachnospiraceae bacterium]|nr:XRE family transcriptional regulator [Lachnospiraceae bacterium]
MDVGKRITYFREKRGLTTNKLANKAGISQSFIRDVELSQKGITVDNLEILCETLGITMSDFFETPNDEIVIDKELKKQISKLSAEQKTRLTEFLRLI